MSKSIGQNKHCYLNTHPVSKPTGQNKLICYLNTHPVLKPAGQNKLLSTNLVPKPVGKNNFQQKLCHSQELS